MLRFFGEKRLNVVDAITFVGMVVFVAHEMIGYGLLIWGIGCTISIWIERKYYGSL